MVSTLEPDLDTHDDDGLEPLAQRFWRPVTTQRALPIVLGLLWLLDAGLQFQPFVFHHGFLETGAWIRSAGPIVLGLGGWRSTY
jgi:hypothetical protein